jgi:histidinol-phosphate aminotransferase
MRRALASAHRYPRTDTLRAALAAHWQRDPSWIALGTGGDDLIRRAAQALAQGPLAAFHPTFSIYARSSRLVGRPYLPLPLDGRGAADPAALAADPAALPGPALVVAVSPNNPTGAACPVADVLALCRARPDLTVLLDEAYVEFGPEPLGSRAVAAADWPDNLVALRTFSKAYGLAGMRVGYTVAPPALTAVLTAAGDEVPVSVVAEAGAAAALADQEHVRAAVALVRAERPRLAAALAGLGLRVWPTDACFVLLEVGDGAAELCRRLEAAAIVVRPPHILRVPGAVRVSVGLPRENEALLAAVRDALAQGPLCPPAPGA